MNKSIVLILVGIILILISFWYIDYLDKQPIAVKKWSEYTFFSLELQRNICYLGIGIGFAFIVIGIVSHYRKTKK